MSLPQGDDSRTPQCNRELCPLYWTTPGDDTLRDHIHFERPPAIDSWRRLALEILGMSSLLGLVLILSDSIL